MAKVARGVIYRDGLVGLDPLRLTHPLDSPLGRYRVIRDRQISFEVGGRFPEGQPGWVFARRELEGGFILEGALDTADRRSALTTLTQTVLLALPVSLALTLGIAYVLFNYLMLPIRKLTEASHAVAQQRFPEPLPVPPGNDEVSDLANSFNRMSAAVKGFLERERSFARYTSHELRTPLATLRLQIEALEQGLMSREETLPTLKATVGRLERILAGLLALTRSPQSEPEPLEAGALLKAALSGLSPQERSRVEVSGETQALILGYDGLLQQALGNLLHNALKYSSDPVRVEVSNGAAVQIRVQDRGPGVPEAKLDKLGEPFLRLQPQTPGLGLGLALVRHVASVMGGTLEFANRHGGGLEARLELPRAEVALSGDR